VLVETLYKSQKITEFVWLMMKVIEHLNVMIQETRGHEMVMGSLCCFDILFKETKQLKRQEITNE
jgi:hypothetical protein